MRRTGLQAPGSGKMPGAGCQLPGARHRPSLEEGGGRLSAGLALLSVVLLAAPLAAQAPHPGKATYDRWCSGCHGVEGRGDGPAAHRMLPRPRDFTQALYQVRTTPSGALPTDGDILHVIDVGMPGTAMPGWKAKLSQREREALVDYLKSFSGFFQSEAVPEPITPARAPSVTEAGLAEGRKLYEQVECWKCHGQQGRGDGPSAPELQDDGGQPIAAADLTEPWNFNGGSTTEAIFMRLRTGLDGTPMPSFSDLLESELITEEQLWRVAQYVRSLGPEKPPRVREVIRAPLVTGALPGSASDEAWAQAERFYVPLVAQIVVRPRWFAPRVDGVWVQALHDGKELALRLTWSDPSRSPDPRWQPWQEGVLAAMEPHEGGESGARPLPDAFAVQFPRTIPQGAERPYFLMGNARGPVYLWHWQSDPARAVEASARGLAQMEPLPGERQQLRADAEFSDGQWRLLLRRPLATADSAEQLQFRGGEPIPLAFFAWDGSNAETGAQGSISSWYYLYLDQPASKFVFVMPVTATLLTLALGLVVVGRAQRRNTSREP